MTAPSTLDDVLTDRQLRFVFEYLIDQNASAAAARAGYSEQSRASQGKELMKNEAVRERIRLELASLLAEAGCSEMTLIRERRRAAFFRAEQMLGAGWEPLPPGEMAEEARRAVEVCTAVGKAGPVIKVRQPDRHKALRALERVHERLDKANQAYWARLEKEGRCRRLAEIEAMDAPVDEAGVENGEMSGVLHGAGPGLAASGVENPEKEGDLSGVGQAPARGGARWADGGGEAAARADAREERVDEKPGVLSGWAGGAGAPAGPPAGRRAVPDLDLERVAAMPGALPAGVAADHAPLAAHWLMRNAPLPSGVLRVA
jgi:phage terminase small subunit